MPKAIRRSLGKDPFIDEFTALLTPMGMTTIEARIHAILLLSKDPLSLDELVRELKISKSSASVAARTLERHGVVHRFPEYGSKRVRYGISDRCAGFLTAQVELLGSVGHLLQKRAAASSGDAVSVRLHDVGVLFLRVHDAMSKALRLGSSHSS